MGHSVPINLLCWVKARVSWSQGGLQWQRAMPWWPWRAPPLEGPASCSIPWKRRLPCPPQMCQHCELSCPPFPQLLVAPGTAAKQSDTQTYACCHRIDCRRPERLLDKTLVKIQEFGKAEYSIWGVYLPVCDSEGKQGKLSTVLTVRVLSFLFPFWGYSVHYEGLQSPSECL